MHPKWIDILWRTIKIKEEKETAHKLLQYSMRVSKSIPETLLSNHNYLNSPIVRQFQSFANHCNFVGILIGLHWLHPHRPILDRNMSITTSRSEYKSWKADSSIICFNAPNYIQKNVLSRMAKNIKIWKFQKF